MGVLPAAMMSSISGVDMRPSGRDADASLAQVGVAVDEDAQRVSRPDNIVIRRFGGCFLHHRRAGVALEQAAEAAAGQ